VSALHFDRQLRVGHYGIRPLIIAGERSGYLRRVLGQMVKPASPPLFSDCAAPVNKEALGGVTRASRQLDPARESTRMRI
jgi:hypothetical protein